MAKNKIESVLAGSLSSDRPPNHILEVRDNFSMTENCMPAFGGYRYRICRRAGSSMALEHITAGGLAGAAQPKAANLRPNAVAAMGLLVTASVTSLALYGTAPDVGAVTRLILRGHGRWPIAPPGADISCVDGVPLGIVRDLIANFTCKRRHRLRWLSWAICLRAMSLRRFTLRHSRERYANWC